MIHGISSPLSPPPPLLPPSPLHTSSPPLRMTHGSTILTNTFTLLHANAFLALVGLSSKDGNRPAGDYSGGMKRKLSVACTLITDPELLFLDEMCAGVDIVAQRTLWRLLVARPPGQTGTRRSRSLC